MSARAGGPVRPTVAVGAIAFDPDGRVLLIRRGTPPGQGLWTVPGGRVEPGETCAEACAREAAEETGLTVEVADLVEVVERIGRAEGGALGHHFVILDYLVRVTGGTLDARSDAAAAGWFTPAEAAELDTTDGLLPVLERARAMAVATGLASPEPVG